MYRMYGHGCSSRKGMGYGLPGYGNFSSTPADELESLRLYKERLELRRKEIESELKGVEKRLQELEVK